MKRQNAEFVSASIERGFIWSRALAYGHKVKWNAISFSSAKDDKFHKINRMDHIATSDIVSTSSAWSLGLMEVHKISVHDEFLLSIPFPALVL